MTEQDPNMITQFRSAAENVSAVVTEVGTMADAFTYIVDLCVDKDACQILAPGCETPLSDRADKVCREKDQKLIAAPLLDADAAGQLNDLCGNRGICLVREDLRRYVSGIDIGVTLADFGVAETGTLVLASGSEDLRLATMVCEIHAAILPKSRIRADLFEIEQDLAADMATGTDYCAFITGASRTADIERVLALGVHGPLELHILLTEA